MSLPSFEAAQAYGKVLGLSQQKGLEAPSFENAPSSQFGGLVSEALEGLRESGSKMEMASGAALSGEGDLISLITAVNEAEMNLEIMTSLRSKIIESYETIMRMPV